MVTVVRENVCADMLLLCSVRTKQLELEIRGERRAAAQRHHILVEARDGLVACP